MKRKLIIAVLVAAVFVALPKPTQALANLPPIIPECDQTRYIIQATPGKPPYVEGAKLEILPEQFGEDKQYTPSLWSLVEYTTNSNCNLNDFLQIFVNLFSWGLYILSILGMLFLFIGGGTLLLSGGSEERVRSGKAIITNTVIGIGIALGSWLIINTLYVALLPDENTRGGVTYIIGNQPWFRTSSSQSYASCTDVPVYPCKGGTGGSVVRDVQEKLYDQGCYVSADTRAKEVDGSFGPKTLAAWNLWQRWNKQTPTNTLRDYDGYTTPCNLVTTPPIGP